MIRFSTTPIPIDHHGFDPCPKLKAIELVKGFKELSKIIDVKQNAFYLAGDLLLSLTTELRNNVAFDGFRFTFGLDATKKVVLIITRERGQQLGYDEEYYRVPQLYGTYNKDSNLMDIGEYGIILVNNREGVSEGRLIELESDACKKMIADFRNIFCINSTVPIFTARSLTRIALRSEVMFRPQPPKYSVVYSYFIGKNIIRNIGKETAFKLFLGYGSSTPRSTAKNMHLMAVSTNDKNFEISPLIQRIEIVGTFDTTTAFAIYRAPAIDIDNGLPIPPINEGPVLIDGSSTCIRPNPPYNTEE